MRAQTIFITGAAAGIGCETARLFHARGWQIGVYDVHGVTANCLADVTRTST
jgi:NAD(P)-dependent dehydrogenase (short-subunit alcohol dehydrogenase family)